MLRYAICFYLFFCLFSTTKSNEIDFYIQVANKRPVVFIKTAAISLYSTKTFKEVMGFCQLLDIKRKECENLYFLISANRAFVENSMFELFNANSALYRISRKDFHTDLPKILDLIAEAMTISNNLEYMDVCKNISPLRMSNKNCSIFYKNINDNRDYIIKNIYTILDTSVILDAKKSQQLIKNKN